MSSSRPPGRSFVLPVALVIAIVSLGACGRSDDPVAPASEGSPSTVTGNPEAGGSPVTMDDGDVAIRELELRLATRVLDATNHDSWFCTGETLPIEYRLAMEANGVRQGRELDGHGVVTERVFAWAGIGPNSVLLDYPETGRQTEIASIRFADDDAFRASDGVSGTLECRRQRYVDGVPTRGIAPVAPDDVDRDAEAAAALVARVETRRDADGDYWYCESESVVSRGYVFAAAGVLADEPRALLIDVPAIDGAGMAAPPAIDTGSHDVRAYRWLATDGATLVLVPLDADVAAGDDAQGTVATAVLGDIVFPVDDVFTATSEAGHTFQCLRSPIGG